MENVGRGLKRALKQIKIIDNNKKVMKVIHQKEEIERKLIEQNKKHHSKAFNIKANKDKIYKKLLNDDIQNRILNGELRKEECDKSNIYEFLTLLQ